MCVCVCVIVFVFVLWLVGGGGADGGGKQSKKSIYVPEGALPGRATLHQRPTAPQVRK